MNTPTPDILIDTVSPDETARVGEALGRCCVAGEVIALEGELGAGKTQFVRGLAKGLGLDPGAVSSPTFVMVQEYEPQDTSPENGVRPHSSGAFPVLVHIDAYRIHSEEDLASIGWHGQGEELREGAVLAVEWASLIRPALGEDVLWVTLEHEPAGRRISFSANGAWRDKMLVLSESFRDAGINPAKGAEP